MEEVNLRWERVQQVAGMLSRNEYISPRLLAGIYQVSIGTAKSYIREAKMLFVPVIEERRPRVLYDTESLIGIRRL
jgi:hypothetical protein